ncbi:MAG: hypothetical protein M1422_07545 [Candidatus Thermoplasmatota archaeon]|jgi:hypothetical protein|nr:hypothetical protein [Candidatus Sysuiplasma jiujiangense]MBX8641603.1 hypothetical protein [Candidatus Sysuiplasma jiujiangense]MCL4318108.1 hypothetical protein [Candidatus Thermoplasmatota archaeon]
MKPDTNDEEPPQIRQPNAYPFDWDFVDRRLARIYTRAKKEHWDPEEIDWDSVNPADYDELQKTAMAYWWAELANFENNAAASFAKALVHVTVNHYDNATQKVTATIVMDECRHDETCMRGCNRLCPKFLKGWKPRNALEAKALRNIRWIYYNGGRYWEGYTRSYDKYRFPLIFTSFMMGEACASKLFNEMAGKTDHPAFREAFKHLAMDESRHLAYTWFVLEDAIPTLTEEEIMLIPKRLRHGFVYLSMILFEPPAEFWELPADFMDVHRKMEDTAAQAGLGVLSLEEKRAAWRSTILEVKRKIGKYGLPFPELPEIDVTGT